MIKQNILPQPLKLLLVGSRFTILGSIATLLFCLTVRKIIEKNFILSAVNKDRRLIYVERNLKTTELLLYYSLLGC